MKFSRVDAFVIRNMVHRHEPPVTSTPVKIILHDKERQFIVVNKPGSIVSITFTLTDPLEV